MNYQKSCQQLADPGVLSGPQLTVGSISQEMMPRLMSPKHPAPYSRNDIFRKVALKTGQVSLKVKYIPSKWPWAPLKLRTYLSTAVGPHCNHVPVTHGLAGCGFVCAVPAAVRALTVRARKAVRESTGQTQALAVEALSRQGSRVAFLFVQVVFWPKKRQHPF